MVWNSLESTKDVYGVHVSTTWNEPVMDYIYELHYNEFIRDYTGASTMLETRRANAIYTKTILRKQQSKVDGANIAEEYTMMKGVYF